MTPQDFELIKSSFKKLEACSQEAALKFYEILFENHPNLRKEFGDNLCVQANNMVNNLSAFVNKVNSIEDIRKDIELLGQRHKKHDVLPEHYDYFAAALLATLAYYLDKDFDEKTRQVWIKAYGTVSDIMINSPE